MKTSNKIIIFLFFPLLCYSQDLPRNPMNTGQFYELSDNEKVEYIEMWFQQQINVPVLFSHMYAEAGGRDTIPWLLEELYKHEFQRDFYDERLSFIVNVLIYFRNNNMLTIFERYYIANILEGKIHNYLKTYRQYDLLVRGVNANIWMLLNTNPDAQLTVHEIDEILMAKYRLIGLLD